jgi:hypothetical protein
LRTSLFLAAPALVALAACSSASPATNGGGGTGTSSTTGTGGTGGDTTITGSTCTATFRWLQKDAYKDTAGRTSTLWPPHTTTTLDVTCGAAGSTPIASAVMANHGTLPDAKDASGQIILQEMKREDVPFPADAALIADLVAKYQACSCEATTKFLSLDSAKDAAVQDLVANVVVYLQQHLVCTSAGGTTALTDALQAGDFPTVLADLPSCTWDSGSDLATGLDDALSTFLATTQEVLSGYHVCNNDAQLQAALWAGFSASKTVTACDSDVPTCKGPAWFYNP